MAGSNSTVKIYVTGDAKGVSRASRDAERALDRLHGRARVSFGRMTELAGGFGLAMGGAGVIGVMQDSVKAFQESEKSGARLAAQLRAIGQDSDRTRGQIETAIQAQSKFGAFDDEDLQDSFTRIVRTTKDVTEALDLNNLAMDIARGKGIDLAAAAEIVAKTAGGNTTALRKMGIQIDKDATAQEALAAAQAAFAGQAAEYADSSAASADRAGIAWQNAQEEIGARLADAFVVGADGAVKLASGVDRAVDAVGGLSSVAGAGGAFLAVSKLGPAALNAAQGLSAMRREAELASRIRTGQLDIFRIADRTIDTSATQANIRRAYAEIGATISKAEAGALAKAPRITAPVSGLARLPGVASKAGASLVSLAGGPMGIAAIAAGGLALGFLKVRDGMTDMEKEAGDAAGAIQGLADAQLASQDAALAEKQAAMDFVDARTQQRAALLRLKQAHRELNKAQHDSTAGRPGAQAAAAAAAKVLTQREREYAQALLVAERAQLRHKSTQAEVARTQGVAAAATQALTKELGGLATKARETGGQLEIGAKGGTVNAAQAMEKGRIEAANFADGLVNLANTSTNLTEESKNTARGIAETVRQLGRAPNKTEIELISNAITTGEDVEKVRRKLGMMPDATTANIDSNAAAEARNVETFHETLRSLPSSTTVTIYRNIVETGKALEGLATGGAIGGRFDGADDIPIRVSRGEVVLNPTQIAIIGRSRVMGALAATGAPTIRAGGGFAGGGKPSSRRERSERMLERVGAEYDRRFAVLDLGLARAEDTPRTSDDVRALRGLARLSSQYARRYQRLLPHLDRQGKTAARQAIAEHLRDSAQYWERARAAGHPDTTTGGDDGELQARLDQALAQLGVAQRGQRLADATLGALGGVGVGAAGVTIQFNSPVPYSPRMVADSARAVVGGIGRSGTRPVVRTRVGFARNW